jgi:pectin methylesterase-like acyl-CoA thioesterase
LSRPRLVASCLLLAVVFGGALAGCSSQDSDALASQACAHVERGITAAQKTASSPAQAARLQAEALDQIRAAVPLAAVAAGEDTTWQALEATLSESSRVPLRYLLPALGAQCAGVG